ncbi:GNAT family N-acetyltransferase [Rhodoferax sp.]|uniref:GNAT family N-acetyltransferase n=1 Tax=Rhodoferax sp. TaxID=50421 RepID=UPI0025F8B1E1|nr:GNAT family N-acetyltransferase [Rhodoferax sp.]
MFTSSHPPDPAHDTWRLRDGSVLTLRPMQAQDGPLLDAMLERLSPRARHNRFHGGVNSRPALLEPLERSGQVAFVLTAQRWGQLQIVAEARYCVDDSSDGAEFALVVDDRWQRRGLGERAMRALGNTAAHAGLHWLHGEVQADNRAMLGLMQRCHFCCTPDAEDPQLVHAESALRLSQVPAAPHGWSARVRHMAGAHRA